MSGNITDPNFKWVDSDHTDVTKTWERHGWKPTTEYERQARQKKRYPDAAAFVTDLMKRLA